MLAHNLGIKRFSFQLETQRHNKAFAIFFTFVEKELSGSEPFFHFFFVEKRWKLLLSPCRQIFGPDLAAAHLLLSLSNPAPGRPALRAAD